MPICGDNTLGQEELSEVSKDLRPRDFLDDGDYYEDLSQALS